MNRVRGRSAATAATAGHGVATLWNPHASMRIRVFQIGAFATAAPGAGCFVNLQRVTARGTPGSTVTPTVANDSTRGAAPTSGALLDLATYTVQPTTDGTAVTQSIFGFPLAAVIGSGFSEPFPEGIEIPPGAGLALIAGAAVIVPALELFFAFDE